MLPGIVLFFVSVSLLALGIWTKRRWRDAETLHEPASEFVTESVRVDLGVIGAVPELASTVENVKWSKLEKHNGGRKVVGGIAVFGPQRLTWAPDDRARSLGVSSWQLPWSGMAGASVRTATSLVPAVLVVTLPNGVEIELTGVRERDALAAIRHIPGADAPPIAYQDPPSEVASEGTITDGQSFS